MPKEIKKEKVEDVATTESPVVPAPKVKVSAVQGLVSDIKATKKKLDAEEKIHFMVPLAEGEKAGAVHECFINGYRVAVPKGTMVQIPKSIANLLAEHYKVNLEVGAQYRIDNDSKKQDALS